MIMAMAELNTSLTKAAVTKTQTSGADGIDAKQFNRRGIGQADDELAVLRQPLADQIEGRHADITVQGEDHHIQLISLWPDGCFRLCRRGFLFFAARLSGNGILSR